MRFATILLLSVLTCTVSAGEKPGRDAWIRKRVAQMEAFEDLSKVPLAGFVTDDKERDKNGVFTYHANRSGRLHFADGTWVIFASHSGHSEEGRRSLIGDVTVARTSTGKYYVCPGHCCPELILRSSDKIESLAEFLAAKGLVSKGKDGGWVEYRKPE